MHKLIISKQKSMFNSSNYTRENLKRVLGNLNSVSFSREFLYESNNCRYYLYNSIIIRFKIAENCVNLVKI